MEPSVEEMVRELWDREKIRQAVTRYCRGVDRMDHDLFVSAYHPDAIDDHGFFVGGPEQFWTWVNGYHTGSQSSHQHIVTNHSCELDGDAAHCETYWLFAAMDREGRNIPFAGGRYLDRLEKRDGEWRIAARKCVPDWNMAAAEGGASAERRKLLGASGTVARDPSDSSYERPLTIDPARIGIGTAS